MSYRYDHRQLADEMEIFVFDEQVGSGLPLWLPNGVAIREELEHFMKNLEQKAGYQRVASPHLAKSSLFEDSGHLRCFQENMFPPMKRPEDNIEYYLKPMNCPFHHKIFASSLRSYRQLPLRIAEFGQVYRYENSGSLRGLSRVRGLCQNDAHIYVDPKEALSEILQVLKLHEACYAALGLKNYRYRLSLRDPDRAEDFDGPENLWNQCESLLREALVKEKLDFFEEKGEAAFYGPKIDVQMPMGSGEESIASIQLDFNSAEKFNLRYINQEGKSEAPWVIHRAPLGSHERFVALLLEYFEGKLPPWLCPIQLYLIPVKEEQWGFCEKLSKKLSQKGIRVQVDNNSGSLSKRVLFAHRLRPFAKAIVGPKEISSQRVDLMYREEKVQLSFLEVQNMLLDCLQSP